MSSPIISTKFLRSRSSGFFLLSLLFFVAFASILFLFPQNVYSVDLTLAWDPNSEEDLAGYRVFCREEGQSYDYNNAAWEGPEATCTIYGLDGQITYYFVARTFDNSYNESGDSNEVCYQLSENVPPTADAGADQTVDEGDTVTLAGSNSSDPDGTIVYYTWTQIAGSSVTLSDASAAQPAFTAADVGSDGESLTFQLTVTDDGGLQSADTCIVNVSWVNVAPTADAGPDQAADEGATVTLDGSNSFDPDGTIVYYTWTQIAGSSVTLSDASAAQPTFTAPWIGASSEVLNFQLTVTDDGGLCGTDSVIITVYPCSSGPVQTIFDLKCVAKARSISLKWSPVADTTCYNVYRSLTSGGPYSKIADCHVTNRCTYPDTSVVNGNIYYYVVTSVTQGVESLYSNEVSGTSSSRKRR